MRKQRHLPDDVTACPVEATLDIIGGKWKGVIIFKLSERSWRFNELCRELCKITPRTLTKQLRELESDGLVNRTIYEKVPPHVEYSLTDKAVSFVPILTDMYEWGKEHAI